MLHTLFDLRLRIFDQLGEDLAHERNYQWAKILPYVQDGIAYMRGAAGDVWDWDQIPAVADTGEYEIPERAQRLVRLAWRDVTLQERSRAYFDAVDWNWQQRTGEPVDYTTDGMPFNRFHAYPSPNVSTAENVVFQIDPNLSGASLPSAAYGKITRLGDHEFAIDPALSPDTVTEPDFTDPDYGIFVDGGNLEIHGNGIVTGFAVEHAQIFTAWFVEQAPVVSTDQDEIPIAAPWRLGPALYALWKVYDEDGVHHNPILSAYFRDWFLRLVASCVARAKDPLPRIVHVMRPLGQGVPGVRRTRNRWSHRFPDQMTDPNGNTWQLIW